MLQSSSVYCSVLQCVAVRALFVLLQSFPRSVSLALAPNLSFAFALAPAIQCNTLQHTATHCNTLPSSATRMCVRAHSFAHTLSSFLFILCAGARSRSRSSSLSLLYAVVSTKVSLHPSFPPSLPCFVPLFLPAPLPPSFCPSSLSLSSAFACAHTHIVCVSFALSCLLSLRAEQMTRIVSK